MSRKIYLFVFLLVCACASGEKSAEKIFGKLESEGKPYYEHLVYTRQYEPLLDKIEKGDEMLIRSASLLSQWVDASNSVSLKYALSRAIAKNPDAVMKLIPEFYSVADICTVPFIEAPIEFELNHIYNVVSALESSTNPSNAHVACIQQYKKFIRNISKNSNGS